MMNLVPRGKKLAIVAVAAGALVLGAAGIAGALSLGPDSPVGAAAIRVPRIGANFNCAKAGKALTRIHKAEGHVAAGLPKLTAAQAKAATAGHTRRADRLQRWITRLESPKFKARLDKTTSVIEDKCHVTALGTPTTGAPETSTPATAGPAISGDGTGAAA